MEVGSVPARRMAVCILCCHPGINCLNVPAKRELKDVIDLTNSSKVDIKPEIDLSSCDWVFIGSVRLSKSRKCFTQSLVK